MTGILFCCMTGALRAQSLLQKTISLDVKRQPLAAVLKAIGEQGDFYFSYNAAILPADSLVSLSLQGQTVRQALDGLLKGYDYLEEGRYVILRRAAARERALPPLVLVRDLEPVTVWEKKFGGRQGRRFAFRPVGGIFSGEKRFEIGGIFNINQANGRNLQLAGILNMNRGSFRGLQVAGIHNRVVDTLRGVQVSALMNEGEGVVKGAQLGPVNYARKLKGVQAGIVNMADSSWGVSIGLLNLVQHGYHQVTMSANDLMNLNVAVRLGNARLYSILTAGMNISRRQRAYTLGYGLGHDIFFGRNVWLALQGSYHILNLTSWDNRLVQLKPLLHLRLHRQLVLFAGPVQHFYTNADAPAKGYMQIVSPEAYARAAARFQKARRNWTGWEIGIAAPGLLAIPAMETVHDPRGWRLELGCSPGPDFSGNGIRGADVRLQKGWERNMALTFTTGFTRYADEYWRTDTVRGTWQRQRRYSIIPLKTGVKIFAGRRFYVAAEAGAGIGVNRPALYFIGSPAFGWALRRGLDVGARLEYISGLSIRPTLRMAYGFQLRR